jgi:membrane dipeptidase
MHPISEQALALHRQAIVCDGHSDTILALDRQKRLLGERSNVGHADLPRLLEGGVTAQLFALFIEDDYLPGEAIRRTLQLLDLFYREAAANADQMLPATTAADVHRAKAEGKLAAILGIEGGEAIEGDLAALRCFYRLGVRLMTLTWNRRNALADGQKEARTKGGLTTLGVEAVQEMNRLGMIVDVSHMSAAGVRDVLQVSQAPIIASHSNARAVHDHPRNLTDEQVRGIADSGGLVGVTLVPIFIAPEGQASLDRLADHIEHLLQVGGEDHVGLGTDYDGFGFYGPADQFQEMPDVSHLPRLTEQLLRRGLSERVIEKVLGGNWMRVFAEVAG